MLELKFKILSPHGWMPVYGSDKAAGLDLFAAHGAVIRPGQRQLIKTNVSVALNPGTYGRIAPRSGLALKHGIDTLAGVIDEDYRGDIGVILYNTNSPQRDLLDNRSHTFHVNPGDRIAQLIIEKIERPTPVAVDDLDATERNDGGFGSTDKPGAKFPVFSSTFFLLIGDDCSYCNKAIDLMEEYDLTYDWVHATSEVGQSLIEANGFKTIPQIWQRERSGEVTHIGGYTELSKMFNV